ncbi:MAG: hypothetical protein K2W95_26440 [Candidatus Obscuribacterales bacterium]|nr:hypothetical protein [Candidatus Obscuribacterales bacterium]
MSESSNKRGSALPPPLTQAYESAIKLNDFDQHEEDDDDDVVTETGSPPGKSRMKTVTAVLPEVTEGETLEKAVDQEETARVSATVQPLPAPRKLITCELLPKFDGPVLQFPGMASTAEK